MSVLVKERKGDQIDNKSNLISTKQLPVVSLTCDDRAFWVDKTSELKHKTIVQPKTKATASSWQLSQKSKMKNICLSKKEQETIREKIIDSYEKINFFISYSENAKRYEEIESYLRMLSASGYCNSAEKKQARNMTATRRLLDSIKDRLAQQSELISRMGYSHQSWELEDDIIGRCLYVVYLMLDQKAKRFSDDEELQEIGRNTFLHNALRFYRSKENRDRKDNASNDSQDDLKAVLQFCYYKKTKEEKQNFQKDMLEWYIKGLESTKHTEQIIKPIQRFLLKDFRGDLAVIVREKRKEKNLTQKQLADTAGLERSMIAKIEGLQAATSLETTINVLTALDLGLMIYPLDLEDTISSCSSDSIKDEDK